MVPGDDAPLSRFLSRAVRATLLAERYPAAAESLRFFAEVSRLQALGAGPAAFLQLLPHAPEDWLGRVLAETQPHSLPPDPLRKQNECPRCAAPPQLGVLRPQGDGAALYLACAICRHEWTFPRTICPNCGEADHLAFASSPGFPALLTQTCEHCKTYLHLIDMSKDLQAIPEADEIAAQPMDVWALEQGFTKMTMNLAGI